VSPLYLLDTNILIHYARRNELGERIENRYQLFTATSIPLVSYVSEAEARAFAIYRDWGVPALTQLSFLFSVFRIVPMDSPDLLPAYVEIDVYSRRKGMKMGKNDLWIAATAKVTGATVLTTDQDFDHLDGILLKRDYVSLSTVE
jgi:tRNA(fMet)-specific endonuclease VapC